MSDGRGGNLEDLSKKKLSHEGGGRKIERIRGSRNGREAGGGA